MGRFLGKAVLDRQVVDIRLERTALLHLLGRSVELDDIIELDPHRCKGLKWILEQGASSLGLHEYQGKILQCGAILRLAFYGHFFGNWPDRKL